MVRYRAGARCEARYPPSKRFFPATIVKKNWIDNTYTVSFTKFSGIAHLSKGDIRLVDSNGVAVGKDGIAISYDIIGSKTSKLSSHLTKALKKGNDIKSLVDDSHFAGRRHSLRLRKLLRDGLEETEIQLHDNYDDNMSGDPKIEVVGEADEESDYVFMTTLPEVGDTTSTSYNHSLPDITIKKKTKTRAGITIGDRDISNEIYRPVPDMGDQHPIANQTWQSGIRHENDLAIVVSERRSNIIRAARAAVHSARIQRIPSIIERAQAYRAKKLENYPTTPTQKVA